jgi:hypothetical protein
LLLSPFSSSLSLSPRRLSSALCSCHRPYIYRNDWPAILTDSPLIRGSSEQLEC